MITREQRIKRFKRQFKRRIKMFKKHCNYIVDLMEKRQDGTIIALMLDPKPKGKGAHWMDGEKVMIKNLLDQVYRLYR